MFEELLLVIKTQKVDSYWIDVMNEIYVVF